MFVKLCLLLSTFLLASGDFVGLRPKPKLNGRIVGGFEINITHVPWQVSMQYKESHLCGASIISDKWILTAAHCTNAVKDFRLITIRVGSSSYSEGGVIHEVKRVIQNSRYNENTTDYDFALLELKQSIEFNDYAQSIKLSRMKDRVKDGTVVLVTGWGDTVEDGELSDNLLGIEIPVVNQQDCVETYRGYGGITPRMLCAGIMDNGGKDSCQGDSGGPMVVFDEIGENPVQIGIVSFGYGCGEPNFPGVYSRIQVIRDWIYLYTGV